MKETINMLFKKSALVLAASLLAMASVQAAPFTGTGTVSVNITVAAASTTTACNFGSAMGGGTIYYASASYTSGPTALQASGGGYVNITCDGTDATPFTVNAGAGNNATGGSRRARLGATADYINYDLTTYAMMGNNPWGDSVAFGSAATGITMGGASNTGGISFNMVVPGSQSAPNGMYTDTVLLTATF